MPRRGENIYKRRDGRWEGRYIKDRTSNDKIRYGYIYGKSYQEVKIKTKEAMLDWQKRCEKKESLNKQNKMTFACLVDEWFAEKKIFYKKSTIVKYQNLLNLYLLPAFGHYTAQQFTYSEINEFRKNLMLNGGSKENGLAPKTVSDILSLLFNIFRYANSRGFTAFDIRIAPPVKHQKHQIRILSVEEQKRLCDYLKSSPVSANLGILLCVFTGLRIGEICALKWEDINMEEKTIFVHQTMLRLKTDHNDGKKTEVLISSPKSPSSIRHIPIPDEIYDMLKEMTTQPNAYLLTGSTKFMEPRTLQYRFKKILEQCELTDANFHALRHTFATRCVELGFDVKSLSEILGHANVNITLNRYVHPSMELKRDNMSRLSELFTVR